MHLALQNFQTRITAEEARTYSWSQITSKPTAFTPSAHAHVIADTTGLQTAIDSKAPLDSPSFTGTVSGITKAMVGLSNVSNTSDSAKPISTATQAALDTKPTLVAGKLPTSYLESVSIGETFSVASQAAMLALTAQPGDTAIRTDNDSVWMLKKAGASTLANWFDITANISAGGVTSVNSQTGTVILGASDVGAVATSRSVTSGAGLQGGGDLTANRVISLSSASTASLAKADTAVQGSGLTLWTGTAAQYAAIGTKSSTTVYVVTA